MKKKFIKVVLFGALTLAAGASFVGCKDYDGDITELRESIDQQKTDLAGKVAAVETSIASLQAAQTSLTAEIAKAKDEATKAALKAQETAIATAKAELEKVNTTLKAAIAENVEDVAELKEKTIAIEDAMSKVLGRIQALEAFQTTTVAALENLGKADEALTTKIDNINLELADQGKRLTSVEAQIVALKEYNTTNDAAINGLIDRLSKLENGQLTDLMIEQIAAEVTKVTDAKLSVIEAAIFKGVTHVSLTENWNNDMDNLELGLTSAEAVRTWIFGSELSKENQISFTKGDKTTYVKEFLIRVSPTNAVLTPANINLINSKGEDMTGLVEISDIKAFDGLLTRGISQNGLWTVSVQMNKEYSEEAFKAAIEAENGGQIRYAVSVNTNLDSKTPRTVVSEYKILFDDASEKTAVGSLDFKVDAKNVTEIHNRAEKSETDQVTPTEYAWGVAGVQDEPIFEGAKANVAEDAVDNRQLKQLLPVVANKAITVQLDDVTVKAATAFYIVLDKKRALSSDDSELTAWNAMESSITGINKMYDVSATKGKAEITFTKDINDVFGFRVYAVNSNGSLVDPDGKAFYVQVGKGAIDLNVVNTTVVVPANGTSLTAVKSEKVAVSFEGVKGATGSTWVATYENDKDANVNLATDAFKLIYLDKDGNEFTPAAATWANVRAIKTQFLFAANRIIDNQPYEGILTLTGANNRVIATLKVTATKVLSQTAPAEFAPKVNQIVNGVYTCYLVPANGFTNTASTTGSMDLKNVFNGLNDSNYEFTFADSKVGNDDAVKVTSANAYTVTIDQKFIDNSTKHATAVKYNYGNVKLVWDAATNAYKNAVHTVTAYQDIQTVYACVYDKAVHSWAWVKDTKSEVAYNTQSSALKISAIQGTNSYNKNDFTKDLSDLDSKGLTYKEAHLYSDINTPITKDEYFTVEVANDDIAFTPQSGTTTPAANVVSTLVLIYTDMYGHDIEIKLPFTVKVK